MQNKKKTLLRIVLYLILAYLPVYVLGFVFSDGNGGLTSVLAGNTAMLYPALAVFLTRLVTREGFHDAYLGFGKRGSGKYYAMGAVYALILPIVSGFILQLFLVEDGSLGETVFFSDKLTAFSMLLTAMVNGFATALHGFGEEFGWRAYLTPKLEELMPVPAAVVVTGVIWALWHGPLLAYGYDFGKDYSFYPYGGFIAMIVMCTFMSAFFTWLTKRTNSVYPASLCHILFDSVLTVGLALFTVRGSGESFEIKTSQIWVMVIAVFPMIILVGAVCMVLLCKKKQTAPTGK